MAETLQWVDDFTGSDGSSANSTYWAFMGAGSIQSNKYSVPNPASAFSGVNLFGQAAQTPADYRIQLEVKLPSLVDAYFIWYSHFGGGSLEVEWNISGGSIYFVGGGASGSMVSFTPSTDTLVLSYQHVAGTCEVKAWKLGDPVPSTPIISQAGTAGTGQFAFQMKTGAAGAGFTWTMDNVSMYVGAPDPIDPVHLPFMRAPGRSSPRSWMLGWQGTGYDAGAASEDHSTSSLGALGIEGRAVAALSPSVVAYSPLGLDGRTVAAKTPSVAAVVPLGLDGRATDSRDATLAALGYLGLDARSVAALTPSVVAYSALGIEGRALVGASLDISTTGIGFLALEGRAPASAAPSTAVRGYLGLDGRTVAALAPSVLARVDLGLTPYATVSRNATALAYGALGLDGRSLVGAQVDISTTGVAYLGLDARTPAATRQATVTALAALGLDARALTTRQALIVVRTDLGLDGRVLVTRTASLTIGRVYFGITGVGGGAPPITIIGPFTLTILDPTRGLLVLDDVRTLAVIDGERTLEVVIR